LDEDYYIDTVFSDFSDYKEALYVAMQDNGFFKYNKK